MSLQDDFIRVPGSSKGHFKLQMKPLLESREVKVLLAFRMDPMYPLTALEVNIEDCQGLSLKQQVQMRELLTNKCHELAGQVAVYSIVQDVQDWIVSEVTKEEEAEKKESEKASQKEQASLATSVAEEDKELQRRIEDDLKRKRELLLKTPGSDEFWEYGDESNSSREFSSTSEDDDSLMLDDDTGAMESTASSSDPAAKKAPAAASKTQAPATAATTSAAAAPTKQTTAPSATLNRVRWKLGSMLSEGPLIKFFGALNLESGSHMTIRETTFSPALSESAIESMEKRLRFLRLMGGSHVLVPFNGFEWSARGTTLLTFMPDIGVGSLDWMVRQFGPMPDLVIVANHAKQIVVCLQFLHERAIYFNNLAPHTLFVHFKGYLRLADYGMSTEAEGLSRDQCIKRDIFHLGCVIYFCVTGKSEVPQDASFWPSFLTPEAHDFLSICLGPESGRPLSVSGFLAHPFLCDASISATGVIASTPPSMGVGIPFRESHDGLTLTGTTEMDLRQSLQSNRSRSVDLISMGQSGEHHASDLVPADSHASDVSSEASTTAPYLTGAASVSRYKTDFEELESIGQGGFGEVIKVRNRLDGRYYAVKKVLLDSWDQKANSKILREVTTLSRLHHQYVVRYYQAWIEGTDQDEIEALLARAQEQAEDIDEMLGSSEGEHHDVHDNEDDDEEDDGLFDRDDGGDDDNDEMIDLNKSADWLSSRSLVFAKNEDDDDVVEFEHDNNDVDGDEEPTKGGAKKTQKPAAPKRKPSGRHSLCLYIQMEYCEKNTLHQLIKMGALDDDERWRLFRQILEGLNNIHHQGIIHRDLKPSNIFISRDGNVKIGDFGLATEGGGPADLRATMSLSMDGGPNDSPGFNDDLTKGVGTPFYISPEQLRIGGSYNRKVDMYALGIMFFEMCHPISMAMERHRVLTALRDQLTFPRDFESRFPQETIVIRWLLNHDAKKRPSARQLLDSELLPSNLDQEIVREALRTIHPDSTLYGDLMRRLFQRDPDARVDFTYDFNSTEHPFALDWQIACTQLMDSFAEVARRYCAVRIEPALLTPKRSGLFADAQSCAPLLDESGYPVALPYDLTLPFARFVALHKVNALKRYCISRVFRKNAAAGQPKALLECDFDVVGHPKDSVTQDVQCLSFCVDFFECLSVSEKDPYMILLNHSDVIDAALRVCNVGQAHRNAALKMFTRSHRFAPDRIIAKAKGDFGLTDVQATTLADLMSLHGTLEQVLPTMRSAFKTDRKGKEAYKHLKSLNQAASVLGFAKFLRFDVSLPINRSRYDGLVFSVHLLKQKQIFAAGGRYNHLLRVFKVPGDVGAVGISVALEKVVTAFVAGVKKQGRMMHASECEILVSSVGEAGGSLEDRLALCKDLWSCGIRAEFNHPDSLQTVEEVQRYARTLGASGVAFVRRSGLVKLYLAHERQSFDTKRSELPELLKGALPIASIRQRMYKSIIFGESRPIASTSNLTTSSRLPRKDVTSSESDTDVAASTVPGIISAASAPAVAAGACYTLQLEVEILDDLKGKKAKLLEDGVRKKLALQLPNLASRKPIPVGCVDLPLAIIKEITTMSNMNTGFVYNNTSKNLRFKKEIGDLLVFLRKQIQKKSTLIIIWSTKDDRWDMLA